MKFKIEKIDEKYFLTHCINGDKGPTIGVFPNYDAAKLAATNFAKAKDNTAKDCEVFEIYSKKEIRRFWLSICFIISFICFILIAIFGATQANAQDIITSTNNAIMMTQLASIDNGPSRPKEAPQQAPKLYRERVPGKPEEGFVPVTPARATPPRYVQERVRVYGATIEMLDDKEKSIKCFIHDYGGSPSISCVKY